MIDDQCVLEACVIDTDSVIGKGSFIQTGAFIEQNVYILPNSVVPSGARLEEGFIYGGSPVQKQEKISDSKLKELEQLKKSKRENYSDLD